MPDVSYDSNLANGIATTQAIMPTRLTETAFSTLNSELFTTKNYNLEGTVSNLTINLVVTAPKAAVSAIEDQALLRPDASIKTMVFFKDSLSTDLVIVPLKSAEHTFKFTRAPIQTRLFLD